LSTQEMGHIGYCGDSPDADGVALPATEIDSH
jgi:hypothetical protein